MSYGPSMSLDIKEGLLISTSLFIFFFNKVASQKAGEELLWSA